MNGNANLNANNLSKKNIEDWRKKLGIDATSLKNDMGNINWHTTDNTNDFNKLFKPGIYSYYNYPTNLPSGFAGWGVCVVLSGGQYKSQILLGNFGSPLFAIRPLDPGNNQWAPNWTMIS